MKSSAESKIGLGRSSPRARVEGATGAGAPTAKTGGGGGVEFAEGFDASLIQASRLHGSASGAPAKNSRGSGSAEMRRRREIAAADDPTRDGVRA